MKSLSVQWEASPKGFKYLWRAFAVLFSVLAVGSALVGVWLVSIGFLFFAALNAVLIMASGSVEADSEIISYTARVGSRQWQMKWDEVTGVEADAEGGLVLLGENKRLVLPIASIWQGDEKEPLLKFIQAQIESRGIPQHEASGSIFQTSKSTKAALPKRPEPPVSL